MPPLCMYAPGAVLTAEGVDGLSQETAQARRASESLPALRRVAMAEATRRLWVAPSRWTCSPPPTTRSCLVSSRVIRSRSRRARMPWPNRTGAGLVAAAGACTASVSSLSASRDLAGVRGAGALGRHAWVRRRSVYAFRLDMVYAFRLDMDDATRASSRPTRQRTSGRAMTSAARSAWLSRWPVEPACVSGARATVWLARRAQAAAVASERVGRSEPSAPAAALTRLGQSGGRRKRARDDGGE